jgi:hypothetical protein
MEEQIKQLPAADKTCTSILVTLRALTGEMKEIRRIIHVPSAEAILVDTDACHIFEISESPRFIAEFSIKLKISARPEPDAIKSRNRSAILNTKIRDIPDSVMPTRIKQGFACASIEIVRDIVNLPDAKELLKYRNIGYKSISQVESFLGSYGLSFGMFNQK